MSLQGASKASNVFKNNIYFVAPLELLSKPLKYILWQIIEYYPNQSKMIGSVLELRMWAGLLDIFGKI